MREQVIHIHPAAPSKPALGAPCNGCGVCCLAEPCPVGMLVSRRRQGACAALRWHEATRQYRCGMVVDPREVLGWPDRAWARGLASLLARGSRRWISAGSGCDATLEASHPLD